MPTVPSDLVDRVMAGENYRIDGAIECLWVSTNRLSVSSLKGGFTRPVSDGNKETVRKRIVQIVDAINATE